MGVEQRQSERSPIELAASYGIPEEIPETEEAKVQNISAGGFCIYSPKQIKNNQEFLLAVDLDHADQITVKVKSVWCQEEGEQYRVGVQIIDEQTPDVNRFLEFYQSIA